MKFALALSIVLMAAFSYAEQVRIPVGEQADAESVVKPQRGLSTTQVERKFGSPESKYGPVGQPAIYYWEYKDFTVYFENDYVIHAVSKLKSKTPVKK